MGNEAPVVLVVDDEAAIRALVIAALRPLGYRFVEAQDGAEAVELAKKERPILMVSDVMMPRMNGWEAVRILRRDPSFAKLAVVMLTGVGELTNELSSRSYGADESMDKPVDLAALLQRVKALLARKQLGA